MKKLNEQNNLNLKHQRSKGLNSKKGYDDDVGKFIEGSKKAPKKFRE